MKTMTESNIVEALKKEVERWKEMYESKTISYYSVEEIDRLKEENERLREELRNWLNYGESVVQRERTIKVLGLSQREAQPQPGKTLQEALKKLRQRFLFIAANSDNDDLTRTANECWQLLTDILTIKSNDTDTLSRS